MSSYTNATSRAGEHQGGLPDPVGSLERLRVEMRRCRSAPFLVTVMPERRPHRGTVTVGWDVEAERLVVAPPPSRWASAEAVGCCQISVLWPPSEPGGYSLIVDGTATAVMSTGTPALAVTASRTVLHRRGPAPIATGSSADDTSSGGTSCRSDCIPIL